MTLCVAIATPRMVMHASDRRVSLVRNHRIVDVDDHRNKAVLFTAGSLRVLVSYCGAAQLEDKRTDRWIASTLTRAAGDPAICPQLWRHFADRLSAAYTASILKRAPQQHVGLEIIVTGFSQDIVLNVTFRALPDGRVSVQANSPGDLPVKSGFHRYFMIRAIGSGSSLFYVRYLDRLRFLGKAGRFKPKNAEALRDRLVEMIRDVAHDPLSGGLVGGNCMASTLLYPANLIMKYFPERDGPHVYVPIIAHGTQFVEMHLRKVE